MTQQIVDFAEFKELKHQFSLLDEKLEKQRIINEEIIKESMKEKLSSIERWYQYRFFLNSIPSLVVAMVFFIQFIDKGFGHWGYCLLIFVLGMVQLYLDRKAYRTLDIKNLPNLSMIQATENVVNHKRVRSLINKIVALPLIILILWTILIACNYTWNLPILSLIVFTMGVGVSWGLHQMKQNWKKLDAVLQQIKQLRE